MNTLLDRLRHNARPPALAEPGGWYGPRRHVGSLDLVRLTEEGRIERC